VNLKLRPVLRKQLKPGSRIVSHDFSMGKWEPNKKIEMRAKDDQGDEADHEVMLWNITKDTATTELPAGDKEENFTSALADDKKEDRRPDVVYWPTPQEVVDKMLEMAEVKKTDILLDLGCGDARIPVTAAKKFGCKAWGYDIDPERIKDSLANVKKNKVEELVTIEKKDIFTLDLSKANVVTLYLLPTLNVKLIPQLEKLKPGSRIVSHDFDMEGVKPDKVHKMQAKNHMGIEGEHSIYLWTTPLKKEKKE